MANVINGTSTGSGGLISSGDDSGILNIQTNETTAMSIDASQSVDFTNNIDAPNTFGFKNRLINSGMVIDQRNAGASGTASTYTVERWGYYGSQASKGTWQQNAGSVTPPTGFSNYLGFTSSSAYSVLTTDQFYFYQRVEGLNTADFAFGGASAQTVTISFWVRSSLTGTFGGFLTNSAANRTYPFSYTISAANTWEQKSVSIAGDTSGTWLTTNGIGFSVGFNLGTGSTYSATAGAWTASSFVTAPTGATSVVGTNGATFYITGVQLEKGTQATSFDFRSYTTELQLCQRYCLVWAYDVSPVRLFGWNNTTTVGVANLPIPVTLRTAPTSVTVTNAGTMTYYASGISYTVSSVALDSSTGINSANLTITTTGSLTVGAGNILALQATGNKIILNGMEL